MKHKIILEIDGVRHKLIKTKVKYPCDKCSILNLCESREIDGFVPCACYSTHYRKCKPGE